jgi:hypothetical protein
LRPEGPTDVSQGRKALSFITFSVYLLQLQG